MAYDVDIVVIGAGPAGMAAAIRARWVRHAEALPASAVLLDPAGWGGIAHLGEISFSGPALSYRGSALMETVHADIEALEIPLLAERAIALRRHGGCWHVATPARRLRCLAVVLATGLRALTRERALREAERLTFLSGSYRRSGGRVRAWSQAQTGARLLVIGGAGVAETVRLMRDIDRGRNTIIGLAEPRQVITDMWLAGDEIAVAYQEGAERRQLTCAHVMLDYHSLLLAPPSLAFLAAAWRQPDGYSRPGPRGGGRAPGLFAAGDCAGPPSSCLQALAQGAEAGFNAYRYCYQRKFGAAPDLFAFYPAPAHPGFDPPAVPGVDAPGYQPVGLTAASRFPYFFPATPPPPATLPAAILQEEIGAKIATVHRRHHGT